MICKDNAEFKDFLDSFLSNFIEFTSYANKNIESKRLKTELTKPSIFPTNKD